MGNVYTDENFPQPIVEILRQLGHDILTVVETGKSGQGISDHEILAHAAEVQRVLVTLNRKHFIRLHHENPEHSGIIVCTVDSDFNALAQRIDEALNIITAGQLIRVNRPNLRP